ncbi:MAG: T9SS type A sorting domain-containing protein [Bacteroidetes bacterium]|uniref:T9SS type A sorting domain-containing protein n=1 Tax=Candidatus Pullibacteroides excrementavium TaxID=2840905 RepID=A0A9D9DR49_9BACT|nr:T9SS type A sorting domain-containing protein [Candidatus Pullibacteroides excrementavium]
MTLNRTTIDFSTTPNNAVTETIMVTGANLTSDVTVTISGENADLFEADASTLTASEIMAEGGKELTITYTPTEAGIHTATLSLSSEDLTAPVTATLNGVATKEVANLAALYNDYENPNEAQVYKVTGDVVVTHKDSHQNRIWVQDAEQEAGKSIILFGCKDFGYSDLNVGDVLNGIEGTLDNYYGLLELKPTQTMTASSTGHAIYVDTVSIADLMVPNYQNALVCLKNVHFTTSGLFVNDKEYGLTDGTDTIPFWVNYFNVYSGESIPEGNLYVTGIIGYDYNEVKITARSMADMVPAPCPVPTNLFADGITATSATINFQSEVGSYALRYAASEEALADAELVTFNETSKEITGLTPETKYFFQVKAICTPETRESEWSAVQNFTTLAEATPAMTVLSPAANAKIDTAIRFAIRTQNFELGTDGHFMVSVRGEVKTSENNDSVMWFNLVSSKTPDTAIIRLVDMEGDTLESGDIKATRIFTIDLKDVATPSFEPAAGSYTDSVEVSIACATEGASLFYALGDAEYESYTKAILLKENATVRAMAVKAGMDTSYAEAEYTIRTAWIPSEDTVLFEPFDAFTAGNADDETNPADGNDIADSLDTYTLMPGWTGERVYQSLGTAKMGGSSKAGYIQLPALNLSKNAGSFAISFMAKAWNNDATSLNLVVNGDTTVVEGLDNNGNSQDNMKPYEFVFSNGTESTSIRFAAKQASKARFFLDDVCVYFVPEEPTLMVAETVNMEAILGDTTEESINVRGLYLTEDVKIACEGSNFYTDSASLSMASVMSTNGADFKVFYKGAATVDSTTLTLTSGELSQTIKVYARAIERTEVANLAALYDYYEDLDKEETFRVTGEIVVTHTDAFNTRIWAQDADMTDGASILIFRAEDYGFENIKAGDVIEGLTGTMEVYNNLLEFLPTETLTVSESGRALHVDTLSFAEIEANILDYQSALVCVEDVVFAAPDSVFATGTNYNLVQESDTLVFRTDYYNADYIETAMPTGNLNITGILTQYFENAQITARNLADIVSVPTANEARETIASRLYPNPTSGMFYLDIERDAQVDIFSANGALVESSKLTAGLHEMNLDHKGIYFIRISNGKAVTVKRVIVL